MDGQCVKTYLLKDLNWDDTSKYTEEMIKHYDEDGKYGALIEGTIEYPKELQTLHKYLPFLSDRRKINKTSKLMTYFEEKQEYVIHIAALKQALNHGLVIKFVQMAWMKPYIEKNTALRKKAKNEFEEIFYKLMEKAVYGKTKDNVRKHRNIKLVTTNARRKQLVSEPNYHTCKRFLEHLMAI